MEAVFPYVLHTIHHCLPRLILVLFLKPRNGSTQPILTCPAPVSLRKKNTIHGIQIKPNILHPLYSPLLFTYPILAK